MTALTKWVETWQTAKTAQETVAILDQGCYSLADGAVVSIADELAACRMSTVLYTPEDLDRMVADAPASPLHETKFRVINATTFAAARTLVEAGVDDPLCLNFASAKNPGGGFLGGSQAQEESLARASGLYASIAPIDGYYDSNRRCGTCLYTHHMIYSPEVPVFRDDDDTLLASPYRVSILTVPAVNAGAVRHHERHGGVIERTMLARMERLLWVAMGQGHNTLVLGAWGCGVFRNDPNDVARWFEMQLRDNPSLCGVFREVVFAFLDRSEHLATFKAFARRFDQG